jgi:hypothetical protein
LKVRVLIASLVTAGAFSLGAESPAMAPEVIVQNYCTAMRGQAQAAKGASMEVEIEASLPSLKKHGKLHALRRISALGHITYKVLGFEGDNTVKNEVIARFLQAEIDAQSQQSVSFAVTPDNYKFQYKGRNEFYGRPVHVFQVTPKKKRENLFKGEIWIDAETYLRVQETGYMVKNPSIWVKKFAFTRQYEVRDGMSVPRLVEGRVDTRLVGAAELKMDFSNFSVDTGDDEDIDEQ